MKAILGTALLASGLALAVLSPANAAEAPGTAPKVDQLVPPAANAPVLPAASGLKVFYRAFGKYALSVDAKGSNGASHTLRVRKPAANAKVIKAFLMAASHNQVAINNGDITLDNKRVTWIAGEYNDIPPNLPNYFHSVLADVTNIVKPKVDRRKTAGQVLFTAREINNNGSIDGETLVVVFQVPSQTTRNTVVLMFGGQQLSGDRFEITLAQGIDPKAKGAKLEMGLSISYSYQGTEQYSIIDVNGKRLSTSAGGQDDGAPENGALITAGGIGDTRANPRNRSATPTDSRSDDEYYNLLPFITKNSKTIRVDTRNPSNDDNIFFAWFDIGGNAEVNKDTDGDGLLDSWERNGYDHDGDGKIDVPLHRMGANWRQKDIFIAYAWMRAGPNETKSHKPSAKALNYVKQAFARAPVKNPNGKAGIRIHFVDKGSVAHDDDLNPVWDEFDALMDPLVSAAERRIFHRMLAAHAYGGGSSSGLSRGIPASDFIESLGKFSTNPGTDIQRAGTIMHELGHNLGLRHGGVDHENYKPNHLSVMGYFHQLGWLKKGGKPYLDYERFDLRDLDENKLNERAGLDRVGGDAPIRTYGVRWYANGSAKEKNTGANANVDWNGNGNAGNTNVQMDINNSGGRSILRARYPEWNNIIYDGGEIGAGASRMTERNMITSVDDLRELTYEEYSEMLKSLKDAE